MSANLGKRRSFRPFKNIGLSILLLSPLASYWAFASPLEKESEVPQANTSPSPLSAPSPSPSALASPQPLTSPIPKAEIDSKLNTKKAKIKAVKTYAIQVGAYSTLKKAAVVRGILQNVAPSQVERIKGDQDETLYRILVGNFPSIKKAEEFAQDHRLKDLFHDVWTNALTLEAPTPESGREIVSQTELDQDPYYLQFSLYCDKGRFHGKYNTEIKPDPQGNNHDLEIKLNWNCIPDPYEKFAARDERRNPSHLFIAPLVGLGSVTAVDSLVGTGSQSDFSYGFEVGGFKSFGGIGPTLEYRFLDHRYSLALGGTQTQFVTTHRVLVGARLPLSHRFEFQPLFGFYTENFYQGASVSTAIFSSSLLAQAAIRATIHLIEVEDRAWLNLTGGFHYLFPTTTATAVIQSGFEWTGKIQSRTFFNDNEGGGIDWFVEYSSRTQNTATLTQSESLFLIGVTALISL
jgi:hypothetical protein